METHDNTLHICQITDGVDCGYTRYMTSIHTIAHHTWGGDCNHLATHLSFARRRTLLARVIVIYQISREVWWATAECLQRSSDLVTNECAESIQRFPDAANACCLFTRRLMCELLNDGLEPLPLRTDSNPPPWECFSAPSHNVLWPQRHSEWSGLRLIFRIAPRMYYLVHEEAVHHISIWGLATATRNIVLASIPHMDHQPKRMKRS